MSDVLTSLSDGLAGAVERTGPSVVRVAARRRMSASGIAWTSDDLILTADHVVKRDEGIQVGLPDGETVDASLVGRDPTTDLAVLRVDAGLQPPSLVEPQELRVGQLVLALGRPGRTVQATLGIVSAVGRHGAPQREEPSIATCRPMWSCTPVSPVALWWMSWAGWLDSTARPCYEV